MSQTVPLSPSSVPSTSSAPLDLRDPWTAGLLAWLIPGAGHWYQRRRSKAVLFFVCILGTFLYGLWIGEGRVVYAAWGPSTEEKRLPYLCQVGVGVVALPAVWQAKRFDDPNVVRNARSRAAQGTPEFWDTFMAPPQMKKKENENVGRRNDDLHGDELDRLNYSLNRRFELGTVYTMVAGLLNLLVIFDAIGGPAYGVGGKKEDEPAGDTTKTSNTATSAS